MEGTPTKAPPTHRRWAYLCLAGMWLGVALGLYDTLTEPFTRSAASLAMRVLSPVVVTLLVLSRYADGSTQTILMRLGLVLSAATMIAIAVRLFT